MMIKLNKRLSRIAVFLPVVLLAVILQPSAQTMNKSVDPADNIEVNLYTFSPHLSLFAWYGHTAIEVKNLKTGRGHMFNFGGFYFDYQHFVEYGLGRFQFWSFVLESQDALTPYRNEKRHIVVQTLRLNPQQKKRINKLLINALKPTNRFYNYNHFLDNCSTRIRDIIDDALEGELKKQSDQPSDLTYRDLIHRMMAPVPVVDFALLFFLNDFIDQPITHWDSMFLPDRLMAIVEAAHNPLIAGNGQKLLVEKRTEQNVGQGIPYFGRYATKVSTLRREVIFGMTMMVLLVLTAIPYLRNTHILQKLYPILISIFGVIFGLLGTILFIMMFFTQHQDTYWNENILLLNPVTLLLFPLGLRRMFGKGIRVFHLVSIACGTSALFAFCMKLLPMYDQGNAQQLRVLLPSLLIIGIVGAFGLKSRKSEARD